MFGVIYKDDCGFLIKKNDNKNCILFDIMHIQQNYVGLDWVRNSFQSPNLRVHIVYKKRDALVALVCPCFFLFRSS